MRHTLSIQVCKFIDKQQGKKSTLEENLNIIRIISVLLCIAKKRISTLIRSKSTEKLVYCQSNCPAVFIFSFCPVERAS